MAHTDAELLAMWRDGRRIESIKIFRAERNASLMEAKAAMEHLDNGMPHQYPAMLEGVGAMTLRDHFAGLAMQGEIAGDIQSDLPKEENESWEDALARDMKRRAEWSYAMADAMLEARSK